MIEIYRCKCQGNECQRIIEDPGKDELAVDMLYKIACFCPESGRNVFFVRPTIRIRPEGEVD
jgi:hypothetical protein